MDQLKEIRLSYRKTRSKKSVGKVTSSETAFNIFYDSWNSNEIAMIESFKVMYLDNGNNVKGIAVHSQGGITGTFVDIRLIMATALKSLSVSIILSHNHPSGSLIPSKSDKLLTNKIIKAADYFDISVLDHIIITPEKKYYSFMDFGLIKEN